MYAYLNLYSGGLGSEILAEYMCKLCFLLFYPTVHLQCVDKKYLALPLESRARGAPSKDSAHSSLALPQKTTSNRNAAALLACIPLTHAQRKQICPLRTSRTSTSRTSTHFLFAETQPAPRCQPKNHTAQRPQKFEHYMSTIGKAPYLPYLETHANLSPRPTQIPPTPPCIPPHSPRTSPATHNPRPPRHPPLSSTPLI